MSVRTGLRDGRLRMSVRDGSDGLPTLAGPVPDARPRWVVGACC
ncbi:hypothetical protein O7621_12370 [Solwaraspora sp. WMMD937]|nr:hypothetical protein [Solwaraspora sp. WMMD937]WFE23990.1 hypothetical protein O7621_12370 [Solwaraspora sp. WMMD937]